MANEITLSLSLTFFKPSIMAAAVAKFVSGALFSISGTTYIEGSVSVPTADLALPLGQVTQPHWAVFHNLDSVNKVSLKASAGGTYFPQLLAGEWAVVPLIPSAVPYAISDTAPCQLEYLIVGL